MSRDAARVRIRVIRERQSEQEITLKCLTDYELAFSLVREIESHLGISYAECVDLRPETLVGRLLNVKAWIVENVSA